MFSATDRTEAVSLIGQYVEHLQGRGQLGRQTLRDLSRVLRYKADVLDRRYIKCVLFPEFSKGARIPAPHTVPTGTWKIQTEYSYTVPAVTGAAVGVEVERNLGFIVDLEIGARNQQCMYLYDVDRGLFSTYPTTIVNGRGSVIPLAEGGKLDGAKGSISALEFASMDPTSIYSRYRLVGASIAVLPVNVKNLLGEINIAQADDFDFQVRAAETADANDTGIQPFVEYLVSPLTMVLNLITLKANGPFYDFATAATTPAASTVALNALKFKDAFKGQETGGTGAVGSLAGPNLGWSPDFDLIGSTNSGLLSRWFGIGPRRYKPKTVHSGVLTNEQMRIQGEVVADNSNLVIALAALNYITRSAATNQTTFGQMKDLNVQETLTKIQGFAANSEIFETAIGMIRNMFPLLTIPLERNRRGLSKVKIQESPYQMVTALNMGTRLIYLPRSSKSLMFRDSAEVLEDVKKDVFWGVTTGLMVGDQLKIIVTRHFEGVCGPQLAPYLAIARTTPDAKTLETVDRIASLAPDMITIPPSQIEEVYARVKDTLGYLIIGDNPVVSKTDTQLRGQVAYDGEREG